MASESFNLTTYYAKRIIGDNVASSPDSALLQTGENIATNTWIFNQTNRYNGTNNTQYGIKYVYDSNSHDTIELYGGVNRTAWVQLDTGALSILGDLNVNPGSIYVGASSINDKVMVQVTSSAGDIQLYSNGSSSSGYRGLYITKKNENGTALAIIRVDKDSNTVFRLYNFDPEVEGATRYSNTISIVAGPSNGTENNSKTWTIPHSAGNCIFVGTVAAYYPYTKNQIFYAGGPTYAKISSNMIYIPTKNAELGATKGEVNGLFIYGPCYSAAANLGSATANVFSYGDPGPQIRFSTGIGTGTTDDTQNMGEAKSGAIIWTNNSTSINVDSAFHFVSQTDLTHTAGITGVVSDRFIAKDRMTIGENYVNTSYNLYVNGNGIIKDILTLYRESSGDLTNGNLPAGIDFLNKDTTTNRSQNTAHIYAYNTHADNNIGMNLVIYSSGNVFIGGGESPINLYNTLKTSTAENLYCTADSTIYLEAKAGTITDRIGAAINTSGNFVPVKIEKINNGAQDIGQTTNRWRTLYLTTEIFVGTTAYEATTSAAAGTHIGAGNIELSETTPYIDFHYNNDTSDYTYRLVADQTNGISLKSKASTECWLYIGNGTNPAGIYWTTLGGGIYMEDSKWLRTYNYKPFIIDINENNTWGIGGHRLALGLSGGSHVSLMLKGGDVMYGFAVNNDGNWYFGKRTTKSFEDKTSDAYIYQGHATLLAPSANNSVNLGDNTHRWKTVQSYGDITATQGNIWSGTDADTTAERDVGVQSGAGKIYLFSHAAVGGDRGLYLTEHGNGSSFAIIRSNTDNFVTILASDVWGDKVRINSNWIGFYNARQGGTRYGYIQTNVDRMYFRKENGVSSYGFDFNSNLYTTGHYYASNTGACLLLACSDLTNVRDAKNGLSANREQGVICYSKDYGSWMGDFKQGYTQSNGQIWARIYLRNYKTDGTNVNNYIYLYANKDGTISYSVAGPAAFRSAISAPSTTGESASGTWGISITGNAATATKLGTTTVGAANRGIYLNEGTATALSWYPSSCTINGGNKANYPWHRFATCTTGTGQWTDKTVIVILHSRFDGGPYGMIKLSVRTNATNAAKSTSAVWIYRKGFAVDDIKISAPTKTTGTDETINAYIKCSTYPRRIAYVLEGSNLGWSLVSSNEPNDTTTSDKKGGTEINASVSGNNATDGATVSHANSADSATNATSATYLKDKTNSTATYSNYGAEGLAASAMTWFTCWNGYELRGISKAETMAAVRGAASGSWGISVTGNAGTATRINGNLGAVTDANGHNIWVSSGTGADGIPKYVSGCYVQPSTCTIVATKVKNAVWNDYAECRSAYTEEPGYCVTETKEGKMKLTTERLQAGCKLTSDTYGTLMGETEEARTPIAVAGRVLAYPYRAREEYELGAAVCSAPDGKIDIMTRDEIMMYPERIVGTVSEIPDYDIWHCGSKEAPTEVQVNGRIWIYVK